MIPDFVDGLLPAGVHAADWGEVSARFGSNQHRSRLLGGLRAVLVELGSAGCEAAYLDGSFVTAKEAPNDFDLCWETANVDIGRLDPVLRDLAPPRAAQKAKYLGDILPNVTESGSGQPFLDFFQLDKDTGTQKGIVVLDPRNTP